METDVRYVVGIDRGLEKVCVFVESKNGCHCQIYFVESKNECHRQICFIECMFWGGGSEGF